MPTVKRMQITIACHQCDEQKRPLTPCAACDAPPLAEPELQAWRLTLHALHMARIEHTPAPAPVPVSRRVSAEPLQAVITLDFELPAAESTSVDTTPIIPLEPAMPADQALSFDWEDEPRRLRRSA
jgi:hypothetical protein